MAREHSTSGRDVYALVTDRIIELLERGTVPWRRPWAEAAPQNLVSRKAYRGINPFILACTGHSSPFWLTFRQARQLGGHVRRGAKSTPVVFWKIFERQTEDDEGNEITARLPVLRCYRVFNLEQCEGIPSARVPDLRPRDFEPIQAAEAIVEGMPDPPKIKRGAVDARYTPATDTVSVPDPGFFDPSPLIDPTGKLAASDLVALAIHSLEERGEITEGDPAHTAATFLVLDFEEEGGRS